MIARWHRVRTFPVGETRQHQQVCTDWVLAPAPVDQAVEALAYNVAVSLLTKLDYVGVLALEFFFGPDGLLQVHKTNEIAPRTHNSGHFSIDACNRQLPVRSAATASWRVNRCPSLS